MGGEQAEKNPAPKTNVHTTCLVPKKKTTFLHFILKCYFYCIILYLYLHFIIIFTQKIEEVILRDLFISKKFIVSMFLNMRLAKKVHLAFSI